LTIVNTLNLPKIVSMGSSIPHCGPDGCRDRHLRSGWHN